MAGKKQTTLTGLWKTSTPASQKLTETKSVSDTADTMAISSGKTVTTKMKKFQSSWFSVFSWLRYDEACKTMHCRTCEDAERHLTSSSQSSFVKGSKNYQKSALVRHERSDDHLLSMKTCRERHFMQAAQKCVDSKLEPVLEAQLRTALWMAKENIADRKFLSLIDLQIANTHLFGGSGPVQHPKGIRKHHQAASEMQQYLATVLKEMMVVRLQNSPYIGIMLDESLDIATKKKHVIFARIIHDGTVKNEFCANVEVQDGKADTIYNCLVEFLESVGIDMQRVSGFGTDGASVMTGRRSGVGVKLQANNPRIIHVWCTAHRIALVSYWAAKKVTYLQQVQRTLVNVYTFYEYSAPRYNKLKELCQVMGEKVKKIKKPTQVRWLSLQDAVLAVYSGWSALVLGLEHEVAENPQTERVIKQDIC